MKKSEWSQFPPDLIRSVFKRLSFGDFERGKSVCWSWYSVSKQCFPKNQFPWLILFPEDKNNCCKLFNPEEKDNIYTTQDLGFEKGTRCVATYGCWLLMQNHLLNFYIVDLLTGDRINLPPVESQAGDYKFKRFLGNQFRLSSSFLTHRLQAFSTDSCQLWVDEESKDYLVMWSLRSIPYVVICKKGDHSWRQIPDCSGIGHCRDMVYKDHKLYLFYLSYSGVNTIRISDFSGEFPRQVSETRVTIALSEPPLSFGYKERMVVTVNGDVLLATSMMSFYGVWLFEIYGMNSSTKEWEKVVSLGDEAMLLDLGITVIAQQGIPRNSIYSAHDIQGTNRNSVFFTGLGRDENRTFVFDLETNKIERPYHSVSSSIQNCTARWFFPNFSRKQTDLSNISGLPTSCFPTA